MPPYRSRRHLSLIVDRIAFEPEIRQVLGTHIAQREFVPLSKDSSFAHRARRLNTHSSRHGSPSPDIASILPRPEGRLPDAASSSKKTRKQLILKPPGEPGHPGSGGYNIIAKLVEYGWTETMALELKESIQSYADANLNLDLAFTSQPTAVKDALYAKIKKEYPQLELYKDYWPVVNILKMHLKASKQRARSQATKLKASGVDGPGVGSKDQDKGRSQS
ncbi:hypothetical protein SISNIDRAFT_488180 [Sistotremastrum niveocremeum HHB9708]|uniref:Uncharacterized protein n=1 Tax=Sistotremastrum niveocremeum HHB9708 TaxID=1314777 RepID=A0A164RJB1_9AGAM|nr:hypothetical protein SISNIDRAFT_488180 [Sistotremastrum niveocremeum HHB9708]